MVRLSLLSEMADTERSLAVMLAFRAANASSILKMLYLSEEVACGL